jgi:hypothetical protein
MPTFAGRTSDIDPPATVHVEELEAKLAETLSILDDVEHVYQERLAQIERWDGTESQKERLNAELERVHQRAREPLVLRLADLHSRLMTVTLLRAYD